MVTIARGGSEAERIPQDPLSPSTLAAYRHVLMEDEWDMTSLAEAAGVPVHLSGDLLDELVQRGLIRASQEHPDEFVPVAPAVGLRTALTSMEVDLERHAAQVNDFRVQSSQLMEAFEQQRLQQQRERFEVLAGKDETVRRVAELADQCRDEISTVVSTLPSAQALEQARATDLELLGRGVRIRGLYLEGHRRQSAGLREYLNWMSTVGGHVRVAYLLPSRLILFDRQAAMVARDPDRTSAGALVIRTPGLINLAETLFEQVWSTAVDIDAAAARRDGVNLSEVELTVIRLLGDGLKDEAVSRRTGLSLRSVRRLIASIGEQMDARSRFELGVKCHHLVAADAEPDDGNV